MKIIFLGGADEVGASGTLIETAGRRILVDCGIRPSARARGGSVEADQLPDLSQIESGSGQLDAVLITHAHIDHTGALELVLERYPDVPVYTTAPTLALTRVLHQDSHRIMQSRLEEEGELPIFDEVAVQRLMSAMVPVPFKTRLSVTDGLAVTFFPAGHIIGAAMIGLESQEGNLLLSGDFSISPQRTVDGARPPAFRPDAFIVESTYGGRLHANRAAQERKLVETVAQVTAAGGKVLIPAFALGRAQEILLILNEHQQRGDLPAIPIWADGMVRTICQTYPAFGEALPLALQERGAQFFNAHIRPVASNDQRNAILWNPGPAVIVASSGMLAGGPSLSYARALAGKPEHAILLTGYQDEESPGRRLQELGERGAGSLHLGKDKVDVKCRIATYSLSAHADESQIINLTETLDPETVFLVHGDGSARASIEKALVARQRSVRLPKAGQMFELSFEKTARIIKPNRSDDLRASQAELNRQRREKMAAYADAVGKWIVIQGDAAAPVLCCAVESDHLLVEVALGLVQAIYPEAVLAVMGELPPTEEELAPLRTGTAKAAILEPNQAIATASGHFPPEAGLRKSGYRLADRILTLTFDFPDSARISYADSITQLEQMTGWRVEVTPETNQSALNALVREMLPAGCPIVKGPAIHREQKRVAVTISGQPDEIPALAAAFEKISGWELTIATQPVSTPVKVTPTGQRMEINAAYVFLKSALEGSSLYRTSLKGDEIVLSFLSRQVAERYREEIAELSTKIGWGLSINPQPNQGAILDIARAKLASEGLAIHKGPSIYPEKAEVHVTLGEERSAEQLVGITEAFILETGFQLKFAFAKAPIQNPEPPGGKAEIVEIPLKLIRLSSYSQSLRLDPAKLEKAVERARIVGIRPPIKVRRTRENYILIDGLYRLRAAETIGLERIPALVE
ncbi:MAG: MBL fold metallo-hydrolase [Anaerolineales bacterium]|nr:MBL fold metallo-hydrolase [Anaerolineales bacterium]